MSQSTDISMPVAKAASAITVAAAAKADVADTVAYAVAQNASDSNWYVIMAIPWGSIASLLAVLYTAALLSEWWWKKLWRPLFESRGWVRPRKRYVLTEEEWLAARDSQRADL